MEKYYRHNDYSNYAYNGMDRSSVNIIAIATTIAVIGAVAMSYISIRLSKKTLDQQQNMIGYLLSQLRFLICLMV